MEKFSEPFVFDLIVDGSKTFIGGFGNLALYDCDGDQDSVLLLMDALLNFSHSYLPAHRGGRMDAPLVFTVALNPREVDDEVCVIEIVKEYPLELYEKALEYSNPNLKSIATIETRFDQDDQYEGFNFTHNVETFDEGPKTTRYVTLKSMSDKVKRQAVLQSKIKAVHLKDSLERVLMSHFFPDIIGNTRKSGRQAFRCTACNESYRRIPLIGKCKCGNKLILTVSQGNARKYLEISKEIIKTYGLGDYLLQRIQLIECEINSIFKNQSIQQKSLIEFI